MPGKMERELYFVSSSRERWCRSPAGHMAMWRRVGFLNFLSGISVATGKKKDLWYWPPKEFPLLKYLGIFQTFMQMGKVIYLYVWYFHGFHMWFLMIVCLICFKCTSFVPSGGRWIGYNCRGCIRFDRVGKVLFNYLEPEYIYARLQGEAMESKHTRKTSQAIAHQHSCFLVETIEHHHASLPSSTTKAAR